MQFQHLKKAKQKTSHLIYQIHSLLVINLHAEDQQPKHTALFWQTAKIHLVCVSELEI